MPQTRIPLKSYNYRPQGSSIGRPKKRWREQLQPWRRKGSKGPILGVYDDELAIPNLMKILFGGFRVTTCGQTWRSGVVEPSLNGRCNGCELSGSDAVPGGNI